MQKCMYDNLYWIYLTPSFSSLYSFTINVFVVSIIYTESKLVKPRLNTKLLANWLAKMVSVILSRLYFAFLSAIYTTLFDAITLVKSLLFNSRPIY